jgi:hypothetical protein
VVVFEVEQEGSSWKVVRNGRLVCYFPTEAGALGAARGCVSAIIGSGHEAQLADEPHLRRKTSLKGNVKSGFPRSSST